jgi:hypothetical protein
MVVRKNEVQVQMLERFTALEEEEPEGARGI